MRGRGVDGNRDVVHGVAHRIWSGNDLPRAGGGQVGGGLQVEAVGEVGWPDEL